MANDELRAPPPRIVSKAEWRAARIALLTKEKELTAMKDAVAAERRALPWVRVEKDYVFDVEGTGRYHAADCGCEAHLEGRRAAAGGI